MQYKNGKRELKVTRPRRRRRVSFEPNVTYFKPAGVRMTELEESIITVEFESVKTCFSKLGEVFKY